MTRVRVNGEQVTVPDGATVADLVAGRTTQTRRVAVARNGNVVPRGAWESTTLAEGDTVEVLAAAAGG